DAYKCVNYYLIFTMLRSVPSHGKNGQLQRDAIRVALRAFGINEETSPELAQLVDTLDSELTTPRVLEDAVIEHDARSIPGFDLVDSSLTGRAVFRRGREQLEVITANKRPLEEVLGVDLIYINSQME